MMARRLAGRFEARPMAAINLTPMVPVLLALFAVVAVAASANHSALTLDVSPKDFPPPSVVQPPPGPLVSVDVGGSLRIDGKPIDAVRFGPELKRLSAARKQPFIPVRAEPDTSYGDYMRAVRLIRRQGLDISPINEDMR
jgi:biopolymer transport protein ExbD